jgi:hypothetical protein
MYPEGSFRRRQQERQAEQIAQIALDAEQNGAEDAMALVDDSGIEDSYVKERALQILESKRCECPALTCEIHGG